MTTTPQSSHCVTDSPPEWRWVPGYEGLYQVSSHGVVRRVPGRTAIGRKHPGKVLRNLTDSVGYHTLSLSKDKRYRSFRVHTLVAAAFIGPRAPGMEVNHIDGNKQNNRPANLEYCTRLENGRHAAALGLTPSGERHGRAKLSEQSVASMRQMAAEGWGVTRLSRTFGTSTSNVYRIIRGRNWKSRFQEAS